MTGAPDSGRLIRGEGILGNLWQCRQFRQRSAGDRTGGLPPLLEPLTAGTIGFRQDAQLFFDHGDGQSGAGEVSTRVKPDGKFPSSVAGPEWLRMAHLRPKLLK